MLFWLFVAFWVLALVCLVSVGLLLYIFRSSRMPEGDLRTGALTAIGFSAFLGCLVLGATSLIPGTVEPQPALPVQEQALAFRGFYQLSGNPPTREYLYAETSHRGDTVLWVAATPVAAGAWKSFAGFVVYRGKSGELNIRRLQVHSHRNLYILATQCVLQGNLGGTCRKLRKYQTSGYTWGILAPPVTGHVFRLFGCHPEYLPVPVTRCAK